MNIIPVRKRHSSKLNYLSYLTHQSSGLEFMWTIIVRLTWEVHCGDIAYFKLFKPTYVNKIHKHKDDDFLVLWSSFVLKVV